MDKGRVEQLERQVTSQKEQLARYEKRIHDVVTAYKGLLKEKEALESSLSAVSAKKDDGDSAATASEQKEEAPVHASNDQIATVMNSLATLSAEKSRMEMSFQRDKKLLRQELQEKDQRIRELEEKVKQNVNRNSMEIEGLKSKLIVERHARERETNDQLGMVKELQKLLSDERQLKESLEMQLNSLKVTIAGSNGNQPSQSRFEDLQMEIKKLKQDQQELEKNQQTANTSGVTLEQLQELMANMKQQHQAALKHEQGRTLKAEEEIRNLSLSHEERVANLEARLAELSTTVGNYDRLRQQDQDSIQKLKEKLLDATSSSSSSSAVAGGKTISEGDHGSFEEILSEIERLKLILLKENAHMRHPVDVSRIFSLSSDHGECIKEHSALRSEVAAWKGKADALQEELRTQKQHISNLQEKITVLNRNIEDQEMELKQCNEQHARELLKEKEKWRQSLDVAVRTKADEMEQHLQKQRERSLKLLEEKENEIKTLKTNFDVFTPVEANSEPISPGSQYSGSAPFAPDTKPNILHYVHEMARKDVEISALRKAKHSAESAMRQAIKDKITCQEELHDQIANLEEQVGRLDRCQSREGANLEYLKNVILTFLLTKDMNSKRHMVNAIGAVLKFSPSETKLITNYFYNKK